jgi:hypothetical protein
MTQHPRTLNFWPCRRQTGDTLPSPQRRADRSLWDGGAPVMPTTTLAVPPGADEEVVMVNRSRFLNTGSP